MISNDFTTIKEYAHLWNWAPDWEVVEDIYKAFPNSFSILTPFAYSYLEEIIRSTTNEYGRVLLDEKGNVRKNRKVCMGLANLAISQNRENIEYVRLLKTIKQKYFECSSEDDSGDNRNSTVHGFMHPRYWTKESFEELIHDIALISPYAKF